MTDLTILEKKKIDHTMYSQQKNCPRLFWFANEMHLSGLDPVSRVPAEFGIAIHAALEVLYKMKSVDLANSEFINKWSKFDGLCPKELRTTTKGLLMLKKYVETYGVPTESSALQTESTHSVKLSNGWMYYGKIDRITQDGDNHVSPVDNKTSSVRNMVCTNPNAQIVGYAFLLKQEDFNVKVATFDFLYFRKGKKGEDQSETISLQREDVIITDEIIQEWWLDLESYLTQLERYYKENYFPKNTNSCKDYGVCPFLFLCEVGVDYREIEKEVDLSSLYARKEWHPEIGELISI